MGQKSLDIGTNSEKFPDWKILNNESSNILDIKTSVEVNIEK